jgi:hypothetical protein
MGNGQIPPLPPGFENATPIPSAAPAQSAPASSGLPPLPKGFEDATPIDTTASDSGTTVPTSGTPTGTPGLMEYEKWGVPPAVVGALKGLLDTGHTIGAYGSKVLNAAGVSVPQVPLQSPDYLQAHGAQESIGKVGEGVLEFFLGDEALKGLSLTDKLTQATKLTDMLEKYPSIAKALHIGTSAMRMATAGTAQAMAHGAPIGEAAKSGAVTGLAGGAIEGAQAVRSAAGVSPLLKASARTAELGTGAGFAAMGAKEALTPQQPGETEQQATERRVGGAIQGTLGAKGLADTASEIPGAVKKAQRATGTGGLNPAESLEKALKPYVGEKYFKENVESILPRLVEQNKISPIKTPEDMADAASNAKDQLWTGKIAPAVADAAKAGVVISGDEIAQSIKDNVNDSVRKHQPKTAARIDKWADTFKGDYPIAEASRAVTDFNQQLRNFYKLSPSEQFGVATAHPEMGMLQDAADAMRGKIEEKIGPEHMDLRKQYGALNQLQRVSEKRAVVYGRQAPISIGDIIGGVGAVASGHPMVAAVPIISKWLNSPEHLISGALKTAAKAAPVEK